MPVADTATNAPSQPFPRSNIDQLRYATGCIGAFQDLAQSPRFVCWRAEQEGDKWRKLPINPLTGRKASVVNPASWGELSEALDYFAKHDDINGVGVVLTGTDGVVCCDLDKCRDPETGITEPWAQKIIDDFGTFTELSPSGTGWHLWMRGRKPGERCRHKRTEIYDRKRYVCLTGAQCDGTSDEIEERQEQLDRLYGCTFDGTAEAPRSAATNGAAGVPHAPQVAPEPAAGDLPCSRVWSKVTALPFVQAAMTELPPAGKIVGLVAALSKNSRAFKAKWAKSNKSDVDRFGDDDSSWDLAIANQLLSPDLALSWADVVALLITFREMHVGDAKARRVDYHAFTIARASDQHELRAEKAAERAEQREDEELLDDALTKLDAVLAAPKPSGQMAGVSEPPSDPGPDDAEPSPSPSPSPDDDAGPNEPKTATNGSGGGSGGGNDSQAIFDTLAVPLGYRIARVTRVLDKNDSLYRVHFQENDLMSIEGDISIFASQAKFRNRMLDKTGVWLPPKSAKAWGKIVTALRRAAEDVYPEVSEAGSEAENTLDWLKQYLSSNCTPVELTEETRRMGGPWRKDNDVFIDLSNFSAFLKRNLRVTLTTQQIALRLADTGVSRRTLRVAGINTSKSCWQLPEHSELTELAFPYEEDLKARAARRRAAQFAGSTEDAIKRAQASMGTTGE